MSVDSSTEHDSAALPSITAIGEYVKSSLGLSHYFHRFGISSNNAQLVLDEIWPILDSVQPGHKKKLRKLALKIAVTHYILPSALSLCGVQYDENQQPRNGSFADVFVGKLNGQKVALKRIRIFADERQRQRSKQLFCRESLIWKNLAHPNIVPFLGVTDDVFEGTMCMIIPWMDNGTLPHYLEEKHRSGQLGGKDYVRAVNRWLHQIASGLAYLHDEGVVHGDLHGGNVLVDSMGNACLADFGLALISESTAYGYASVHGGGAVRWKAPELFDPDEFRLRNSRPTQASDVFSFACVCVELYSGKPPMEDLGPESTSYQIGNCYVQGRRPKRPQSPDNDLMPYPLWSLVTRCWEPVPEQRLASHAVTDAMDCIINAESRIVGAIHKDAHVPTQEVTPLMGEAYRDTVISGGTSNLLLPRPPRTQTFSVGSVDFDMFSILSTSLSYFPSGAQLPFRSLPTPYRAWSALCRAFIPVDEIPSLEAVLRPKRRSPNPCDVRFDPLSTLIPTLSTLTSRRLCDEHSTFMLRTSYLTPGRVSKVICYMWFSPLCSPSHLLPRLCAVTTVPPFYIEAPTLPASLQVAITPHFRKFMYRILDNVPLSPSVIVLALYYIFRLKTLNDVCLGESGSEYRLAIGALNLANKMLDDSITIGKHDNRTLTNKMWSEVSGISLVDVNAMERDFLSGLRCETHVSKTTYDSWLDFLEYLYDKQKGPLRSRRSNRH